MSVNRFSEGVRYPWKKTLGTRRQSLDFTHLENLIPAEDCLWLSQFEET